jgi:hypothetical protein
LPYKYTHKIPSRNPNVIVHCIVGSGYIVSWFKSVDNTGNSRLYILFTGLRTGLVAIELFFLLKDSEVY